MIGRFLDRDQDPGRHGLLAILQAKLSTGMWLERWAARRRAHRTVHMLREQVTNYYHRYREDKMYVMVSDAVVDELLEAGYLDEPLDTRGSSHQLHQVRLSMGDGRHLIGHVTVLPAGVMRQPTQVGAWNGQFTSCASLTSTR